MRSEMKEVLAFILEPEERVDFDENKNETAFNLLHAYIEAELSGREAARLYPEVQTALEQSYSFEELYEEVKGSLLREQKGVSRNAPIKANFDFSFLESCSPAKQIDLWQVVERAGKQVTQLFTELRLVLGPKLARFDNLATPLRSEWKQLSLATRTGAEYGRMPLLSLPSHEHDMSLRLIVMPPETEELHATLTVEVTQLSSGQAIARCRVTIRDGQYRMLESYMTQADGRVDFFNIQSGDYVLDLKYRGRVLQIPITISWDAALPSEQITQDA